MSARQLYLRSLLPNAFAGVEHPSPSYRGKVRDVFDHGREIDIVASDRVSAFDVVLGTIPLKGMLLTEQATFWLEKSHEVIQNHFIERTHPRVMRCRKSLPFQIEIVVRGYLAGSLMRSPKETRGQEYGLRIGPNLEPFRPFENPIVTPTTKESQGAHDAPISLNAIVDRGLASRRHLDEIVSASLALFELGSAFARERGLILVDTKYEFGLIDGKVALIDELHTADSSRFWIAETYEARLAANQTPDMLDKERLRKTLLSIGFDGSDLTTLPTLTDEMRMDLADHYWELTEKLIGREIPVQQWMASPAPHSLLF